MGRPYLDPCVPWEKQKKVHIIQRFKDSRSYSRRSYSRRSYSCHSYSCRSYSRHLSSSRRHSFRYRRNCTTATAAATAATAAAAAATIYIFLFCKKKIADNLPQL